MIIYLSFGPPELIPSGKDAIEYFFDYSLVNKKFINKPEEESETRNYKIKVSISGTLNSMWKLSTEDLLKVLYEYTKRHLENRIINASLTDSEEYFLSTDSHPKVNPFDPSRIIYLNPRDINVEDKMNLDEVFKKKETSKNQNLKSERKAKVSQKQKGSIEADDTGDFGNDPNRKLALDSDLMNDTAATGELDLGYEHYINAFVALIDRYGKDIAPLTIGIHGEWGAGKTTLMSAIRMKLDDKKYVSIWFNAWKYKEEESIWRAFLRHSLLQVGNSLGASKRFWYKLKLLRLNFFFLFIVGIILLFPVAYGVSQVMNWVYPNWFLILNMTVLLILALISKLQSAGLDIGENLAKKIGKKTSADFMGDLENDLQDFISIYTKISKDGNPLIVFIDDLDRCPPERIVEVMNAINTITNLESTIFFLGYDTNFVGMAIGKYYSNVLYQDSNGQNSLDAQLNFGLNFLDKIVQIPFRLPSPGISALNQYIGKVLQKDTTSSRGNMDSSNSALKMSEEIKITDKIEITIEGPDRENLAAVTAAILNDGVEEFGLNNIRKIKRFINTFRLLYEISSDSGLLKEYNISPNQLGYFLFFHLFFPDELKNQLNKIRKLSYLESEDEVLKDDIKEVINIVSGKLDIVFTNLDNREIEKYMILDKFVRGSVN